MKKFKELDDALLDYGEDLTERVTTLTRDLYRTPRLVQESQ